MTIQGCDYAWGRPDPKALYDAGYRFACRYLSYDTTGKNLSPTEAEALGGAGIAVVSNWEWTARGALGGRSEGAQHARDAVAQHLVCGGPADRPIYFSVDFNPTSAEMATVCDYFRGVATVLPVERIGVYGGVGTVAAVWGTGLARWAWQTYAWSDGQWITAAHIHQVRNGVQFGNVELDVNQALVDDYGQWTIGSMPAPAPTWTEALIMNLPTLSQGANNRDVGRVQGLLRAFGYTLAVDDSFGPITDGTVRAFQSNHGLLRDGIVGQHTWTALLTA